MSARAERRMGTPRQLVVVVVVDGAQHARQGASHRRRDVRLAELGLRVLRLAAGQALLCARDMTGNAHSGAPSARCCTSRAARCCLQSRFPFQG
jgi:hypothetical protein